jgi:hypothetical protein
MDLSLIQAYSGPAKTLGDSISEFQTYIENNRDYRTLASDTRQRETITTSFVESSINQVVSSRFVKEQQMAWTLRGAHLLVTDADEGPQPRTGGGVPAMVSAISN